MKTRLHHMYQDLPVLVTGHTGFKGSWLSAWLNELGAMVIGYSVDIPTTPSNFQLSNLEQRIIDVRGDVKDYEKLRSTIEQYKPRVIFHLAGQAIVLRSYEQPKHTIDTNAGGTLNILEALRETKLAAVFVGITSDKCYEDQQMIWGYRESDRLGGYDPYGASKAMAELVIASYRNSFFNPSKYKEHGVAIASARAGNAIGGGDFADYRLIPDCMKALMAEEPVIVRNPTSVRPWQHVLVPLSGYLWLATKLVEQEEDYTGAWNFGPLEVQPVDTQTIAEKAIELWGNGRWEHRPIPGAKKETAILKLNWEKAANKLNWRPAYSWNEALTETVDWFKSYQEQKRSGNFDMYGICVEHINAFVQKAKELKIKWAENQD